MIVEVKEDLIGKYKKVTHKNGRVEIFRFFKELGLLVKITEKHGKTT